MDAPNPAERRAAAAAALCIGGHLDESEQIACPAALCAALGLNNRRVYDNTVARYAHGRRRQPPRAGSATARMLAALKGAGDVRFGNPSPKKETAAA